MCFCFELDILRDVEIICHLINGDYTLAFVHIRFCNVSVPL